MSLQDLLHKLNRASAGRAAYVAAGSPDHVVDQQLLNHMTLLSDLARQAGATDAQLHAAIGD